MTIESHPSLPKGITFKRYQKAESIRRDTEAYEIAGEMPFPSLLSPQEQDRIRSEAREAGILMGENYLWRNRVYDIGKAWTEAIIEDLDRHSKIRKRSFLGRISIINQIDERLEGYLERISQYKPTSYREGADKKNFIFALGNFAADKGFVEQAQTALELLESCSYEKGLIAAKIGDDETAKKTTDYLLNRKRHKVTKEEAYRAAEIGNLLNDRSIILDAIAEMEEQRSHSTAAELALQFGEIEIAKEFIPIMIHADKVLHAGRIAFKAGDVEKVREIINRLIKEERLRSAMELTRLIKDEGREIAILQILNGTLF